MRNEIPFLNFDSQHLTIHQEMMNAIENVLHSNSFILANELATFETDYANYQQTSFCVGVANGLDALYLSLKALGIKKGDEVLVPSNTYIATWLAIAHSGATIIPIEPNLQTYNIDISKMEVSISPSTKCIIPVHLFGQACEMDKIMSVANNHSLFIVEDNAQAHGACYNEVKTGSWGHINATSFYPTKNLGAIGDGGAITTNHKTLCDKILSLRNYGSSVKYYNELIGVNSRLDEIQAAVLRIKLKHLDQWNAHRKSIADAYQSRLQNVGDLVLPFTTKGASHVFHVYTLRSAKRDELQKQLLSKGIHTMIHYPVPPHLQKAFAHLNYKMGDFPIAEELAATSLSLPIWPGLEISQVDFICEVIKGFFTKNHL